MKFHSFLENIHLIIFGCHSIQKNIHVLTRALIQFKISFNSKKILVIHSKKLFIFLKNHLSNTPTSSPAVWTASRFILFRTLLSIRALDLSADLEEPTFLIHFATRCPNFIHLQTFIGSRK